MQVWRRVVVLSLMMPVVHLQFAAAQEAAVDYQKQLSAAATPNLKGPEPKTSAGVLPATAETDPFKRGIAQYQAGNYEEALDDFTQAKTTGTWTATAAYYLGLTLKKMQTYEPALDAFKEATVIQPAAPEAFLEMADTQYALSRYDEALHTLDVVDQSGMSPAPSAFLRGLTLAKKRNNDEALAAFDRAAQLDPSLRDAADLQKAGILQRTGKIAEARILYQQVVQRGPGTDAGSAAQEQLDAMVKSAQPESHVQIGAGLQFQYDSNVILKPDNFALSSATTATGEISDKSDLSAIASVQARYETSLSPQVMMRAHYAFTASKYQDLTEFDLQSHSLGVTPVWRLGENSLPIGLTYNYVFVDGKKYLSSFSLAPQYSFIPSEGRQASLSARYQKKEFLQPSVNPDEDRDSSEIAAGISWNRLLFEKRGYVNARYEWNSEDAAGGNWSYMGHRLGASVLAPLGDAWKVSLGLDVFRQVFKRNRQDTTETVTAQALYALTANADLSVGCSFVQGDSTLPVYAYTKNTVTVGINARF